MISLVIDTPFIDGRPSFVEGPSSILLTQNHACQTFGGAPPFFVCHTYAMAGQKIELGPTGRTVAENVKRVRDGRSLNYADLSRKLVQLGRAISPLAVRRIEDGSRRVDVDDLMALAVALGVPPNSLLLPHADPSPETSGTGVGAVEFREVWAWANGSAGPIGHEDDWLSREIARPVISREADAPSTQEALQRIQELVAELAASEAARRGHD